MIGAIGAGLGAVGSGLGALGSKALGYVGSALGSPLGQAGIGAAAGVGGDLLQGVINNYFGKKSSKYSAKQNYHYQRKLNQWLIPFQLEQQNKYAAEYQEMYSRNSPSWNVAGLRNAGLNPILAAGGGFSSAPASRPTASVGSSSGSGYQPSTRGSVRFDPLTLKQLQLMDAEIEGQKIRNENDKANRGLDGKWGAISRMISEAQNRFPDFEKYLNGRPLIHIEKKANANLESFTDDERKALMLYEVLQHHGYNDVDSRHEGGEEFWEHLENAWAKRRRNTRAERNH